MADPVLSVVVPVWNEEQNVAELHRRLANVLDDLAYPYEIIVVNDGSRDSTLDKLRAIQAHDPHLAVLDLARNFGHQAAVTAGIDHARGEAVVVMDGDLQDPPEVIPQFIERWREGYDVVYGVRTKRKEGVPKRLAYASFYRFLSAMSDADLPLDAGDFCLMDQKVVEALRQLPEKRRYVRGLRSWVGFRQVGLAYERAGRYEGRPKYSLRALLGLATSGFVSFSKVPLRLAAYLGVVVSVMAFLAGLSVLILRLVGEVDPQGWTSLMVVVLFLGGVQLITVGIVGEYIGYILDEVRQRPTYIAREWVRASDQGAGTRPPADSRSDGDAASAARFVDLATEGGDGAQ